MLLISFSFQDLWFLRPQWFWGFVPIGIIVLMFLISFRRKEEWKRSFSKTLLPFLTIQGTRRQLFLPRLLLALLLSAMLLALAGPTWEEREHPGNRTEAGMVVVLDLSLSMLAEDIQPNRLDRAKLKLMDLFDAQPGIQTALVAYAGSAHTVVPFTKDYGVIESQIEALSPNIMPLKGSNIDDALTLTDSLLLRIEAPSSVLLVTDGIRPDDMERIRETSRRSKLEIMILGTPGGSTIPSGNGVLRTPEGEPVVAGFDPALLGELAKEPGINIVTVTLDESDVRILAKHLKSNLEFIKDSEQNQVEWKDAGYWLLIPLVLISLLWFRRGWMVHWVWMLFIISGCNDLFSTRDQQGQRLFEQGLDQEAAERFESGQWKGYAYARAGDLEAALEVYSSEATAEGFYNMGVLYARAGNPEAALEAFTAALELDPQLQEATRNLERMEEVMDSIQMITQDEDAKKPDSFEDPGKLAENQEQAQESDQSYQGEGDVRETGSKEVDETNLDFFNTGEPPPPFNQQGAKQSLLRQVEEDPSLFLRRKFAHQLNKRTEKPKNTEEDW